MGIPATYISSNSFSVDGEVDGDYPIGRKVILSMGVDCVLDTGVASATYSMSDDWTVVVVADSIVTSKLVSIEQGTGDAVSVGWHYHTGKRDAGYIPASRFTDDQVTQILGLFTTTSTTTTSTSSTSTTT